MRTGPKKQAGLRPLQGGEVRPLEPVGTGAVQGDQYDPSQGPVELMSSDRSRPPPLKRAISDPSFEALPPSAIPVPSEVVELLTSAKRVLIIGHVPPDGDTLGGSLALRRTLAALGTHADVCLDDDLPGKLRRLPDPGEVHRAADLDATDYDLVVVVDTADNKRIGNADQLLQDSTNVLVLDHHQTPTSRSALGLPKNAQLNSWISPDAEAASLLVAAIASAIEDECGPLGDDAWQHLSLPALAGIVEDTGWFTQPECTRRSMQIFKHLLVEHHDGELHTLKKQLHFGLPVDARAVLVGRKNLELPPKLQARYDQLIESGHTLHQKVESGVMSITCPKEVFQLALEVAQHVDPSVNALDVRGFLMKRVDQAVLKWPLSLLAIEDDSKLNLSTRSQDEGLALRLAQHFEGGGHPMKAAARLQGSLTSNVTRIERHAHALRQLQLDAKKWSLGRV